MPVVLASFVDDWGLWFLVLVAAVWAASLAAVLTGVWVSRTVVGGAVAVLAATVASGVAVRAYPVANIGLVLSFPIGLAVGTGAAALLRLTGLRYRLGGLDRSLRSLG